MRLVLAYREKRESFSLLCRRFGISRKSAYKWLKRYRAGEGAGAEGPAASAWLLPESVSLFLARTVGKSARSASAMGSEKAAEYPAKDFSGVKRVPAVSTLALWLRQSGLARKREARSARSFACMQSIASGATVQRAMECGFQGVVPQRDGRRCEPLTVRDVFSRFVLTAALLPNQSDGRCVER